MIDDLKSSGDRVRRQVLGDEHVDKSQAAATEFTRDFQELATEYCWGAIWTREGLDLKSRSLLNVGMLAALGRMHELSMHVGGALRNAPVLPRSRRFCCRRRSTAGSRPAMTLSGLQLP